MKRLILALLASGSCLSAAAENFRMSMPVPAGATKLNVTATIQIDTCNDYGLVAANADEVIELIVIRSRLECPEKGMQTAAVSTSAALKSQKEFVTLDIPTNKILSLDVKFD